MKLPIVSYLRRYWWVIAIIVATFLLARWDAAFAVLDIFVYFPVVFAISVAFPLLWRNLFNRNSTDAYIDTKVPVMGANGKVKQISKIAQDFKDLPDRDKVWLATIQSLAYFIASAIITAALAATLLTANG